MGFLRKVGRKIKKGVKKLLGGKFGKILGGIGLSMMFWGGANAMFGKMDWFKNLNTTLKNIKPFANNNIEGAITRLDDAKFFGGDDPLNIGQKFAKVGVEVGKGFKTAGESIGEKIKKPFTGNFKMGETVADITEAGLKQTILSELEGEPVDEGGYGIMPNVGSMEAPQAQYVQAVRNDMPNFQVKNFEGLNQSLFYGTLSPQFLAQQAREMELAATIPPINITG